MDLTPKYYLIRATALPEVFLKVASAKRMLETGDAKTVHEAVEYLGISRSVFYKYRDAILPFYNMATGKIITFQAILKDRPGVLSELLSAFAKCGANILTINQSIPTNGHAAVTISAETEKMSVNLEEMMALINAITGIIKFEILAGE